MNKYTIFYNDSSDEFISIKYVIDNVIQDEVEIQLAAWRPGRYELGNFGQYMFPLKAQNGNGKPLVVKKIKKDRWKVKTAGAKKVIFTYRYAAVIKNAGGTFKNAHQLVITPANCLIHAVDRMSEPCQLEVNVPEEFTMVCALQQSKWKAKDFYHLAASPLISGFDIHLETITCHEKKFHVCFQGNVKPQWHKILTDFSKFINYQISVFGSFPSEHYYFLNLIFDEKHYHGVEHLDSTLIALGPDSEFENPAFYLNLLGISSHELYHYWNICRIRPKELWPYDYSEEAYFETGYVAEGVTTYFGDYALGKSGTISTDEALAELSSTLHKHLSNEARNRVSVAESSIDLWLDGYTPGIKGRKVSIYAKGATIALILDLWIRKITKNEKSIIDVMRLMWTEYGLKEVGYTSADYQKCVEEIAGQSAQWYFDDLVYGLVPVEKYLMPLLSYVGLELVKEMARPMDAGSTDFKYTLQRRKDLSTDENENFMGWIIPE